MLEIDLNEYVSKEIREQINSLNERIETLNKEKYDKSREIKTLTHTLEQTKKENKDSLFLIEQLRESYNSLAPIKKTEDSYGKDLKQVKFEFICDIFNNFFNITPTYTSMGERGLSFMLTISFYKHKELLLSILELIAKDDKYIDFKLIKERKLPEDWTDEQIKKRIIDVVYNANGQMFGCPTYWNGNSNLPLNLILKDKRVVEYEIWVELLNTIKQKKSNYYYLFAIHKYNPYLTEKHIEELGEVLIELPKNVYTISEIENFINTNLKNFNKKTLDYFFELITKHNQFNVFNWQKFPVDYQMKYLYSLDFNTVFEVINKYDCKWSVEEKETFLENYFKNKNK